MSDKRGPTGDDAAFAPTLGSDPATAQTVAPSAHAGSVALAVGARLGGRYVIRAFLGEGGMGAVYRALDETLGEDVALKVVRGAHASNARLRDEVRIAQRVTHRNVCRTFDLEDIDGFQLVKMELVDGDTLAQVLARDGKLPVERAIAIARAIAEGLAAAHAGGIVHRDLKPGNVMVTRDQPERVVLMDFGLAQREGETEIAGTPGYMSPEQLAGTPLDTRTDLYALGCVLYEMLAGCRVFGGNAIELAARHAAIAAPDVRTKRPDVPRWLARATARLLAKDPRDRSAGVELLTSGPRRRWLALPIVAAVAAGTAIVAWRLTSGTHWLPAVDVLKPIYDGELASAPAISRDGAKLAYASDREQPGVHRVYVAPLTGEGPRAISAPGASLTRVRWARDGRSLLGIRDDGHVGRLPAAGGVPADTGLVAEAVDDCGDALALRVAMLDADRLVLAHDGRLDELYRSRPGTMLSSPRCDPTGRAVLVTESTGLTSSATGDLLIVDRAHHVTRLTTDHTATSGAFTPDGRAIVFGALRERKIRLFVMSSSGGARHELTREGGPDLEPDVAPDGRRVAFHTQPTSMLVVVGGPGREPVKIALERQTVLGLTPLRTRDLLLAERADRDGAAVVVIDVAARAEHPLANGSHPFPSADDHTVYFSPPGDDRTLASMPIDGGAATTVAVFPARIVRGVDAADGVHVLLDRDGTFEGWRLEGGKPVAEGAAGLVVPAPAGGWRVVQIPDGRRFRLRLVAPGTSLADGRELVADSLVTTWIDDHHVGYAADHAFHLLDVTSGAEQTWPSPTASLGSVVAPDGQRWFETRLFGHTTRRLLTNFDRRPWKDTR